MNKNSTRFYSSKQEKQIAKSLNGKMQANSGATLFSKGDVVTDNWIIEAKTCMKEQQRFTIKKEWLDKIKQEGFAMNKEFYTLAFNFGPDSGIYYVLDERTLRKFFRTSF